LEPAADNGMLPVYDEDGDIVRYESADPVERQMEGQIYIPYLGPAPEVGIPLPVPAGGGQLAPSY
jgi:hypothetical protein